jgi:hypothetical protein
MLEVPSFRTALMQGGRSRNFRILPAGIINLFSFPFPDYHN